MWFLKPSEWKDDGKLETFLATLVLIAVALVGAAIMTADAQTYKSKPPPTDTQRAELDLPLTPPKLGAEPYPVREQRTPEPEPPADDPRDTPPPVFYGEEIEAGSDSLIYVLDASGSMRLDDRWGRARDEAAHSVAGLSEGLRFNVITYQGNTVLTLWPETRPASAEAKAEATAWLGQRRPGGGTPTAAAMAQALSERENRSVVLLSDGIPNSGPGPCRRSIRGSNVQGAVIDTFGVGARGKFRSFLQGVAADSGGSYTDVP